jgi:hypothetical protein
MALRILRQFFDAINAHHNLIPDSEIAIDEILIVGKETTFVRRGAKIPEDIKDLHNMFVENCRLPRVQFLAAAEVIIERQLREQQHLMPIDYALRTLAPAISGLHSEILRALPLESLSEGTESIGLEHIGRELVSGVHWQLHPTTFEHRSLGSPAEQVLDDWLHEG